jgi:hypothetical protein
MLQGYVRKNLGPWNHGATTEYCLARHESGMWYQFFTKGYAAPKKYGKHTGWDEQVADGAFVPYNPEEPLVLPVYLDKTVPVVPKKDVGPPLELNLAAKAHAPAAVVWYPSGARFTAPGAGEYMLARASAAGYQMWLVSVKSGNCWGGTLIPTKSPKVMQYTPSATKEDFEKAYGKEWTLVV